VVAGDAATAPVANEGKRHDASTVTVFAPSE
jgi:hypothetical protein